MDMNMVRGRARSSVSPDDDFELLCRLAMGEEFNTLTALAKLYHCVMTPQQQRAYDRRLGTWMLAADIAATESLDRDVIRFRRELAIG